MATLDDLLSSGGKSFKFENPGDTITGTIAAAPLVRQTTEFGTGKPQFWDDGSPQEQIVVTLNTALRDPSDPQDDGARSVYIKGWGPQLRAFRAAIQTAGAKPAVGGTFTATFTGYGQKSAQGGFPPKMFEYRYEAPNGLDGLIGGTPATHTAPATATPQAAQQASVQPIAQAPTAQAQQFSREQIEAMRNAGVVIPGVTDAA